MTIQNTEHVLTLLGLSDKERQLYLALLGDRGEVTISEASKYALLPRTTVYDLMESLAEKGLVEEVSGYKVQHFKPKHPSSLLEQLARRRSELVQLEESLPKVVHELSLQGKELTQTAWEPVASGVQGLIASWKLQLQLAGTSSMQMLCTPGFYEQVRDSLRSLEEGVKLQVLLLSEDTTPMELTYGCMHVRSVATDMIVETGYALIGEAYTTWKGSGDQLQAQQTIDSSQSYLARLQFTSLWRR